MRPIPKIRRRFAIAAGACLLTTSAFALVGVGGSDPAPAATVTGTSPARGGDSPSGHAPRTAPAPAEIPIRPTGVTRLAAERALIAEPPVPRPGGRPCRLELFSDQLFTGFLFYDYTPPAACPGPWAKVVLTMDLSGPRPENASTASLSVWLDDVLLYRGAPQIHDGQPVWRVERDLTDYASMLTQPQSGELSYSWDNPAYIDDDPLITGTATLLFYPARPWRPAPSIPDVVSEVGYSPEVLPRNIIRAYVDVIAQGTNRDGDSSRFWYSCVPTDAADTYPALISMLAMGDFGRDVFSNPRHGCTGGSFREVEVLIDGQIAGLAPVFPWLPSNLHDQLADTLDRPVPSVQAINFVPYRVDITPFAGLLNDGAPHSLEVRAVDGDGSPPSMDVNGTLLLYLDEVIPVVSGVLTRNTLDSAPATPTVDDDLVVTGDALEGDIGTFHYRRGVIEGYVDSSRGRVRSSVVVRSWFSNGQHLELDGLTYPDLRSYRQNLRLAINMHQRSRRYHIDTLLLEDFVRYNYTLDIDYGMSGDIEYGDEGDYFFPQALDVRVHQGRRGTTQHYREGMARRYYSQWEDVFTGERAHSWDPEVDSVWQSHRNYVYRDSRCSCYAKELSMQDGIVTNVDVGARCGGDNHVRRFARPDGSPVSMGWIEQRSM